MKTPPELTRMESLVNSDEGNDCCKAATSATQSTTASEHDDEGTVTSKSTNSSNRKFLTMWPISDPEVFEVCPPIPISLAATLFPKEEVKPTTVSNAKVHDEAAKKAKAAKKKDAKKQFIEGEMVPVEEVTTLMIRGIPCSFTDSTFLALLHAAGLEEKYNFFHIPRNEKNNANLGYAFVNLVDAPSAEHCTTMFQGVQLDPFRSPKTCRISPATIQGLPSLRHHFRNAAERKGKFFNQQNEAAKRTNQ
eukprot:gnl/MRDRNA2_/MRDRNA2_102538_c0_seq1.p1 gnl/MRDRNA2_/MRDRNA2_102538_c0~~gnl/MRDRNA2_/MRDRNA2_102538_c0_seq1.p1  ORF type:complete len:249 (+),score=49.10 gnl/MRDRNA2_/MRDRNA2_102538_c0_seq1:496-1242(+)